MTAKAAYVQVGLATYDSELKVSFSITLTRCSVDDILHNTDDSELPYTIFNSEAERIIVPPTLQPACQDTITYQAFDRSDTSSPVEITSSSSPVSFVNDGNGYKIKVSSTNCDDVGNVPVRVVATVTEAGETVFKDHDFTVAITKDCRCANIALTEIPETPLDYQI